MNNLETVVRERNEAYYKLEVGESAERPGQLVTNMLGNVNYYFLENKLYFAEIISLKQLLVNLCIFL